VVVQNDVTIR